MLDGALGQRQGTATPAASSLLLQAGVPAELRPWVWFEVSGASALKARLPPAYYMDLVDASAQGCTCQRQIELVGAAKTAAQQGLPWLAWLHRQSIESGEKLPLVVLCASGVLVCPGAGSSPSSSASLPPWWLFISHMVCRHRNGYSCAAPV